MTSLSARSSDNICGLHSIPCAATLILLLVYCHTIMFQFKHMDDEIAHTVSVFYSKTAFLSMASRTCAWERDGFP